MSTTNTGDKKARRQVVFDVGGSGRAARHMQDTIQKVNDRSMVVEYLPNYVDNVAGKAEDMADLARAKGIAATFDEGRIEDLVSARNVALPVVIHVDRPDAARDILASRGAAAPTFAYLLIAAPGQPLMGLMAAVVAGDSVAARDAELLYTKLASVTANGGSAQVVGERAPSANRLAERRIRAQFASHFERNWPRAVADGSLEDPPLTITHGGDPEAVVVLPPDPTWRSPKEVEVDTLSATGAPLQRGVSVTVVELGVGDSLRLHQARLRRVDGAFAVNGAAVPGSSGVQGSLPGAEGRSDRALARSTTLTGEWTTRNAVLTSD